MSAQVTSGTVAKPSRFDEGWTCLSASVKSDAVMHSGASCASVSGSGCARRKCTIELAGEEAESWMEENGGRGASGFAGGVDAGGASTAMEASPSTSKLADTASGRVSVPSESCWKIRFTAMMPAAPVRAARSAPTYPGVAFANARKSKSPSSRSFDESTRNIL